MDIPSDWSELSSLLHCGVEEGNSVKCRFPLRQVVDIQLILGDTRVSPVETSLDTLWRFISELQRRLQQIDGELRMWLCSDPASEVYVNRLCCLYSL